MGVVKGGANGTVEVNTQYEDVRLVTYCLYHVMCGIVHTCEIHVGTYSAMF